jgi:hypothetical protein
MNSYEGPAVLVTEDGTSIPINVRFRKSESGGLQSWEGAIAATMEADAFSLAPGDVAIRMPDGTEGRALISNASVSMDSSGTNFSTRILGNGPAPF